MAIIYLLTLCLLVFLFRDRHRFILFYSVFSIVLQPWVCLRFAPPALTVSFVVNILLCFYCWKGRKKYMSYHPLSTALILSVISVALQALFSSTDMIAAMPAAINTISSYAIILMIYHEIKNQRDLQYVLMSFVWVGGLLLGYGVYEYFLQDNPVFREVMKWGTRDEIYGKIFYRGLMTYEADTTRFGIERSSSLISIYISWGGLCVIFVGFMMFCRDKLQNLMKPLFWWGMVIIATFCLYTTGSRSAYLYYIIVVIPFFLCGFNLKTKLFGILLSIIGLIVFKDNVMQVVDSIVNNDKIGGSSVEMRLMQLKAVEYVLNNNLIWGLGIKGIHRVLLVNSDVLGAESVWFQTLISGGIVGVFLLVGIYGYGSLRFVACSPKKMRFSAVCFVLGWIIFCSITSSPGLNISYLFVIMSIIIRYWHIETGLHK